MKKLKGNKGKRISFQVTAEPGSEVFVVGTFNNWDVKRDQMRNSPGDGIYKTTLVLAPGRYEYKFVVNGEWHVDSNCPDWVQNDQGSLNSVITV
jgi:1,4-alpha-glucan branching enzyme